MTPSVVPTTRSSSSDFHNRYTYNSSKEYGSSQLPEDRDQALVQTPYGKGMVIRTRKQNDGKKNEHNNTNNDKKMKSTDEDPTKNAAAPPPPPTTTKQADGDDEIIREIELLDWKKPSMPTKPSMLYTSTKFPSIQPEIGNEVMTKFGRGKVIEIRNNDSTDNKTTAVVVQITSWRLAKRSKVTCYLSVNEIQVVRPMKIYEMSSYDNVDHAQELKLKATKDYFAKKQYKEALELYEKAVDCVRYVQHTTDSTNELRADLLVILITCYNNAATCCLHDELKLWDRSIKFGKNAVILLDALYEKKDDSKILKVLNNDGIPNVQLFGTWKIKSYIVIGRGYIESGEYDQAMDTLKNGLDVVSKYKNPPGRNNRTDPNRKYQKQLISQEKELRRYMVSCKERIKQQKLKEKQRAVAMFGGGNNKSNDKENGDDEGGSSSRIVTSSASSSSTLSPTTTATTSSASKGEEKKDIDKGGTSTTRVVTTATASAPSSSLLSPPSSPGRKFQRRVSFADGSRPGDEIPDDGFFGGFLDEHKEALILVGGVMIGSFLVNLMWNGTSRGGGSGRR